MASWRDFLKNQLLKRDIVLSRPPGQFNIGLIKLPAIKRRGLNLSMVVDAGAADGGFAREIRAIYPDAKVLCIEPRTDAQPKLKQLASELSGITIAQTLVGDKVGTVDFYEHLDQSSMLEDARGGFGTKVTQPITTIDELISSLHLPAPDMLKLDLQGAELLALRGATEAMKTAQVIQVEASFMPFYQGQPLFAEVVAFLAERKFRLYDVHALWHRPLDGALAQGDFLFIREDHPLVKDARWDKPANA